MAAERGPRSKRGRPALDWNRAFLHYAALPPEQRSYAAVAAEFGVSVRTVERHGRSERWRERAGELDREAARTAATRLVEVRVARLGDLEKLVDASFLGYAQKLRDGTVRLSAADLPRLYKLLCELWQEPPLAPPEAGPARPGDEEPVSLEHKLQVLHALHESGVFDRLERPRDAHHANHDDDRDRDRGREREPAAEDLPPRSEGPR